MDIGIEPVLDPKNMYIKKIFHFAGCHALIIPVEIARAWRFNYGDYVMVKVDGQGNIIVSKVEIDKSGPELVLPNSGLENINEQ